MAAARRGLLKPLDSYDSDEESVSSDDELINSSSKYDENFPVIQQQRPAVGTTDPGDMIASIAAPVDRWNVIYIILVLQGVGMLLPWNFFITAKEYFTYKFTENDNFQSKFENAFALSAMFPGVVSLFLNIFLTGRVSRTLRLALCLMIMFIVFTITTVLVKIDTQDRPNMFFGLTVASCVVLNTAVGVFQGTIFGVAGIVGQRYIQAVMSGQALAGIFAAVADLTTKLANPNKKTPVTSALIYFTIACVFIIITAISCSILFKLPRIQFYFRRVNRHAERNIAARQTANHTKDVEKIPYILIFKAILDKAVSVIIVFGVTLCCFPAIIAQIDSTNKGSGSIWDNELFPTLVCFLIFNIGDWCGRIIAGIVQIVAEKNKFLVVLCLARVVFIPLFLMCNYNPTSGRLLPYVFNHDFYPIIFNILFSVSNGYFGSLCMMHGPKLVAIEYAETAGTMMSLFLQLGLTMGACLSFAF